jgi:hypothetical protein
MGMEELIAVLLPIGFVTSVQSNDIAGWVRTTGKLPLSLGLRKYVVATAVGDAVAALPAEALIRSESDVTVVSDIANVVDRGIPRGWEVEALRRAEPYRRSIVAHDLASFLESVLGSA